MIDLLAGSVPLDAQEEPTSPQVWRVFYWIGSFAYSRGPYTLERARELVQEIGVFRGIHDVRIGQTALWTCTSVARMLARGARLRVEQVPAGEAELTVGDALEIVDIGPTSGWILCGYAGYKKRILQGKDWRFTMLPEIS
jgi:hypothetical protein